MDTFALTMALFWTFADGAILVAMRWCHATLERRPARLATGVAVLAAVLAALAALPALAEARMGAADWRTVQVVHWSIWSLFCVTWAMIEGSILVYVLRIHALLACRPRRRGWGVPLLPLGLFALYLAYTWGFATVGPMLDEDRIRNLAAFWVKVCAAFWTTFEWAVVIVGFRTYALLRRRPA